MDWMKFASPMGAVKMEEAGGEGGGAPDAGADAATGGALGGSSAPTATTGGEGAGSSAEAFDFGNATPQSYFEKVTAPTGEGIEFDSRMAAERYGQFCIDNKISPDVLTKYLAMESKFVIEQNKAAEAEEAKRNAEFRKGFEAQGAVLKRDFSPQQIQSAVDVLGRDFAGDKDFMRYATREMSNNPSLVKLLVNWADTHQTDTGVGAGSGATAGSGRGFAARWTGKNY